MGPKMAREFGQCSSMDPAFNFNLSLESEFYPEPIFSNPNFPEPTVKITLSMVIVIVNIFLPMKESDNSKDLHLYLNILVLRLPKMHYNINL